MKNSCILLQVPGEIVGQALQMLPSPSSAEYHEHIVEMDVEHLGKVRLFVERRQARHHKHRHYYWHARRAELIPLRDNPRFGP